MFYFKDLCPPKPVLSHSIFFVTEVNKLFVNKWQDVDFLSPLLLKQNSAEKKIWELSLLFIESVQTSWILMTVIVFLVHLFINIKLWHWSSEEKIFFSHFLHIWVFAPRSHTFVNMCFSILISSVEIPFFSSCFFLNKNEVISSAEYGVFSVTCQLNFQNLLNM